MSSEFIDCNEFTHFVKGGLVNYTHILITMEAATAPVVIPL
jgi:hypothetical protein